LATPECTLVIVANGLTRRKGAWPKKLTK